MAMTLVATIFAISKQDGIISEHPSVKDLRTAASIHVLAFSSLGDLLVSESEGSFDFATWEEIYERARMACMGSRQVAENGEDVEMAEDGGLHGFLRSVVRKKVEEDQKWRTSVG